MPMLFILDTRAIAVCRLPCCRRHGCCERTGFYTSEAICRQHLCCGLVPSHTASHSMTLSVDSASTASRKCTCLPDLPMGKPCSCAYSCVLSSGSGIWEAAIST